MTHGPSYGQYFIQQANTEDRYYSIAAYVNASQPAAAMSYTGYALQAIVRDLTDDPNIKVNFLERPLPFSLRYQTYISAAQGTFSAILFATAYMMVSDTLVMSLIKER
jgi:hypothetical protein